MAQLRNTDQVIALTDVLVKTPAGTRARILAGRPVPPPLVPAYLAAMEDEIEAEAKAAPKSAPKAQEEKPKASKGKKPKE